LRRPSYNAWPIVHEQTYTSILRRSLRGRKRGGRRLAMALGLGATAGTWSWLQRPRDAGFGRTDTGARVVDDRMFRCQLVLLHDAAGRS